jgi:hypothetical protein
MNRVINTSIFDEILLKIKICWIEIQKIVFLIYLIIEYIEF